MTETIHHEIHRVHRTGWLRAAVLGANDGIVSTASLILGVAAANASTQTVLIAGTAGLVAGAMSMAAGEYVSVSSQADIEKADLAKEAYELEHNPEYERQELKLIYIHRGLSDELADQVATQLTEHDAIGAHARDELGIMDMTAARPMQAAITSALAFSLGAALPLLVAALSKVEQIALSVPLASLASLAGLGLLAAKLGDAGVTRSIARITFWGGGAMLLTHWVGKLVGTIL
ncbi:MAG: VIT family protein [Gammaproteobacteria bacterium]|nr:VIT family protein [Gammaproteobacteria bacterium]NNC97782.1 VIT family protein [Gammaproteobacteria bacterium]NNM14030.1 VIT family protein [Gammaproteobacteria bacterium]